MDEMHCWKCDTYKPVTEFSKRYLCRKCNSDLNREYREKNKEYFKEKSRKWYIENKKKSVERLANWIKEKLKTDPVFKIIAHQRSRIGAIFRDISNCKSNHTLKLIGCTKQQLKEHLEKQFKPGMSWDNYGTEWDLDHKIPIAYFKSIGEIEKAFHYTNLQPLWKYENQFKSDKIVIFPDGTIKPLSDYF